MNIIEVERGQDRKEQIGSQIMAMYRDSKTMKAELHDEWWTHHAFYDGKQYITYRHGKPQEPKAPSWRIRLVNNYCQPIVNTVCAKLTQQRPGFIVRPMGNDDDRRQKAKAGEFLLDYLHRELNVQSTAYEVVFWASVTGTGFFNCFWDSEAGQLFETEGRVEQTGFPVIEAWSPFDVYPDPEATRLHNAKWVILSHNLTEAAVELRWPGLTKSIDSRRSRGVGFVGDEESTRKQDFRGYTSGIEESKIYRLLEYQERPNKEHPEGRRIICSEGVVLEETSLPMRRFSLAEVRVGEMGDRFWGTGSMRGLVPLQRELNRTISQVLELRNLATQPPWVAAAGSISRQGIKNRPDHVIFYNANMGPAPSRVPPVPIPNSLYELVDSIKGSMYDISGVHEVSQGRAPTGVVSGRAIGMLSDQDATKLGPASRTLERSMAEVGSMLLEMWKKYMQTEITISVLGEGKRPEAMRLHRDHIDSTDVDVRSGSLLPKFPSYEREVSLQLLQLGGFGPMEDPETLVKFRKAYGTLGLSEFIDDDNSDRNYARQENDMMTDERMHGHVAVRWWENHAVHISEILTYMKGPAFRELPPEVQQFYEQHLAEHYRQLQMQMQGAPTWVQALGMDPSQTQQASQGGGAPPQLGAPQAGSPEGMIEAMPPEIPFTETGGDGAPVGMVGGGTPELNQAVGPRGPGFNPMEERGAF